MKKIHKYVSNISISWIYTRSIVCTNYQDRYCRCRTPKPRHETESNHWIKNLLRLPAEGLESQYDFPINWKSTRPRPSWNYRTSLHLIHIGMEPLGNWKTDSNIATFRINKFSSIFFAFYGMVIYFLNSFWRRHKPFVLPLSKWCFETSTE